MLLTWPLLAIGCGCYLRFDHYLWFLQQLIQGASYCPRCVCLTAFVFPSRKFGLAVVQTTWPWRAGLIAAACSWEESPTGLKEETQSLTSCTDCVNEQPVWCADCFLFQGRAQLRSRTPQLRWPTAADGGSVKAAESSQRRSCPLSL